MSNKKKWTTATGEKIRIKDLEDDHLMNIIQMLERMSRQMLYSMYDFEAFISGEQALIDIDNQIRYAEKEGPAYFYPIYDDLIEEAERRELIQEMVS